MDNKIEYHGALLEFRMRIGDLCASVDRLSQLSREVEEQVDDPVALSVFAEAVDLLRSRISINSGLRQLLQAVFFGGA